MTHEEIRHQQIMSGISYAECLVQLHRLIYLKLDENAHGEWLRDEMDRHGSALTLEDEGVMREISVLLYKLSDKKGTDGKAS